MKEQKILSILLLIGGVSVVVRAGEGSRGRLPPGMKVFDRKPRVDMRLLNSMNKITQPKVSPWPDNFYVTFFTNVTTVESNTEGAWGKHAIKAELFFESGRRQRIIHGAGSSDCRRFFEDVDCSLVFPEEKGMFALSDSGLCCLDMPETGTPQANWTIEEQHQFVETRRIKGRMCHGFQYRKGLTLFSGRSGDGYHIYWQDSVTQMPCAIEFVRGDEKLSWIFDVSSLKEGLQDDKLFSVPETCTSSRCQPLKGHEAGDADAFASKGQGAGSAAESAGLSPGLCCGAPCCGGVCCSSSNASSFEGLVDEVVGLVDGMGRVHDEA
jgi:hypothetical protein